MKTAIILPVFLCALLIEACVQTSAGIGTAANPAELAKARPTVAQPAAAQPTSPALLTETPVPSASPASSVEPPTGTPRAEVSPAATPIPDASPTPDAALLELGKEVYRKQACGVCHTLAAMESKGTFGPPQDNLAVTAAKRIEEERYKGTALTAAEYIRESIVNPQAFFVDGYQITRFPMPVFTNLSVREVDALVYLLMQPSPPVNP
ncbi:MAG: hypothetical protein KF753_07335 [Caldilineaceae bacterium]|nr:hypothetical protein [Caldilineaceae bacterium]